MLAVLRRPRYEHLDLTHFKRSKKDDPGDTVDDLMIMEVDGLIFPKIQ